MSQAYETRVLFYQGDALRLRFATPAAQRKAVAAPEETLRARLDELDPAHSRRIVLEGGRPTEHPAFARLLEHARTRGLTGLTLEIDAGAAAEPGAIARWQEQGVERVFAVVGGIRRRVHEHVMQAPGGFDAAMQGLAALAQSTMATYVVVPVVQANKDDVEPLLDWLAALPARVRGFLLEVPEVRAVPKPVRGALLSYGELSALAVRVFRTAQRSRIEYGFGSARGLSPCAAGRRLDDFGTVFYERVKFLRHQKDEPFTRVASCNECSLGEVCPGLETAYVETFGAEGYTPVPLGVSMDWKLRPLHKLDKRDYKNVSDFDNEGGGPQRSLLRINGHCNMACSFCFVDRTAPDFDADLLRQDIDKLTERNKEHLVLSGGEPTLHPQLPALIAHARSRGVRTIEMQSNGVKAADPAYARALADAGLNKITVSLHSADPEHSDRITQLPGAFGKTVRALHNFRALGVETQIAHVITKVNYKELPDTVRFFQNEFPSEGGHLSVCFAIAQGISDLVYSWVIPRFSEIGPYFREALELAQAGNIGFGGMLGQGGYPPCMLGGELKYYAAVLDKSYRSPEHATQFHKAKRCSECSFDPYCLGVRKAYVECYGESELTPFQADVRGIAMAHGIALPELPEAALEAMRPRDGAQKLVQLRRRADA